MTGIWLEGNLIPGAIQAMMLPIELGVRLRWDVDGLVPIKFRDEDKQRAARAFKEREAGRQDAEPRAGLLGQIRERIRELQDKAGLTQREAGEYQRLGELQSEAIRGKK